MSGHDHDHVHGPGCHHDHDLMHALAPDHIHGPDCDHDSITAPITRASPKIGRNDPCPCGSGKKYKKCCDA